MKPLITFLFAVLYAGFVMSQSAVVKPINPKGWADEEAFLNWRRSDFLSHVKGAINITLADNKNVVTWEVDWKRQKLFCESVIDAVFKNQKKLKFPNPNFSIHRDSVDKLKSLRDKVYPKCNEDQTNASKEIEKIKKNQKDLMRNKWGGLDTNVIESPRYYINKNQIIIETAQTENPEIYEECKNLDDAKMDSINYCGRRSSHKSLFLQYQQGLSKKDKCSASGGFFEDGNAIQWGYAHNNPGYGTSGRNANHSKILLGAINNEFIFFEYGKYESLTDNKNTNELKEKYGWQKLIDKPYVLATGLKHVLLTTLSRSDSFDDIFFKEMPSIKSNNATEQHRYTCVINFE